MMNKLINFLDQAQSAYHAAYLAAAELQNNGFVQLFEGEEWELQPSGKYYVMRDGSSLIAFTVPEKVSSYRIAAAHLDSPCFKLKGLSLKKQDPYVKAEVEAYGGAIYSTFLDRELVLAGRITGFDKVKKGIVSKLVKSKSSFVIPNVAIHFNRATNKGVELNAAKDMQPLMGLLSDKELLSDLLSGDEEFVPYDADIVLTCGQKPFEAGLNGEFICAPRIDNLTSSFAGVEAITSAKSDYASVLYLADNEEVGSSTKQGAAGDFLRSVISRIHRKVGCCDLEQALYRSMILSVDNAHATHPNHPELSANTVAMGGGVVIKHHAGQNYTTDAVSSAIVKHIATENGIAVQDFYMRADLPCGGTLGALSARQLSIRSVDIGLPQLAMHSAVETMAKADYLAIKALIAAFYTDKFVEERGEIIF